jgi:hypothetical protein
MKYHNKKTGETKTQEEWMAEIIANQHDEEHLTPEEFMLDCLETGIVVCVED